MNNPTRRTSQFSRSNIPLRLLLPNERVRRYRRMKPPLNRFSERSAVFWLLRPSHWS